MGLFVRYETEARRWDGNDRKKEKRDSNAQLWVWLLMISIGVIQCTLICRRLHVSAYFSEQRRKKKKKKSKKGKLRENHKEGKECKERKKGFQKESWGGKVTKTGAGRRSKDRTEREQRMENQYVFMYSPQPLCFLCCYCVFGMLTCSGLWRLSMSRACLYVCLKCLCSA